MTSYQKFVSVNREEQTCQILSRSDLERRSIRHFKERPEQIEEDQMSRSDKGLIWIASMSTGAALVRHQCSSSLYLS